MSTLEVTCGCPYCEGCEEVEVYDHPLRRPLVSWWATILGLFAWYQEATSLERARYSNAFHLKRLIGEHAEASLFASVNRGIVLDGLLGAVPQDPPVKWSARFGGDVGREPRDTDGRED